MIRNDIETLILDAALDPGQWQTAFARIADLVPGRRLHVVGFNTDKMMPAGGFGLNYEESFMQSFVDHYRFVNPYAEALTRIPKGLVTANRVGLDMEDFLRSEYYHDWVKPQEDCRLGGGAIIDDAQGAFLYIGADIPYRSGETAEALWLADLAHLMPLIRHAMRVNEQLRTNLDPRLSGRPKETETPFLAVSKTGQLVASNYAAERHLETGEVLILDPLGRVRLRPGAHLRHQLSDLLQGDLRLPRQVKLVTGAGRWTLTAQRLTPASLMFSVENVTRYADTGDVSLILTRDVEEVSIQAYLRRPPLRLTESEIDIALLFSDGYDPETIAEMRAVRRITVTNQLKTAAQKLGVNGQVGIVVAIHRLRKLLEV